MLWMDHDSAALKFVWNLRLVDEEVEDVVAAVVVEEAFVIMITAVVVEEAVEDDTVIDLMIVESVQALQKTPNLLN